MADILTVEDLLEECMALNIEFCWLEMKFWPGLKDGPLERNIDMLFEDGGRGAEYLLREPVK